MRFLSALVSAFNSVRGQRTRSSTSKSSGLDPEPHPFSAQENRPALRGCWDISCTKEVVEKSLPRNKAFAFIMELVGIVDHHDLALAGGYHGIMLELLAKSQGGRNNPLVEVCVVPDKVQLTQVEPRALLQEYSLSHLKHFSSWNLDKRVAFLFMSSIGDVDIKCICLRATQGVSTEMGDHLCDVLMFAKSMQQKSLTYDSHRIMHDSDYASSEAVLNSISPLPHLQDRLQLITTGLTFRMKVLAVKEYSQLLVTARGGYKGIVRDLLRRNLHHMKNKPVVDLRLVPMKTLLVQAKSQELLYSIELESMAYWCYCPDDSRLLVYFTVKEDVITCFCLQSLKENKDITGERVCQMLDFIKSLRRAPVQQEPTEAALARRGTASNSWNTIFHSGSDLLTENAELSSVSADHQESEPQLLGPHDMWCSTDANDLRLPVIGWVFQEPPPIDLPQLEPYDTWCSTDVGDLRFLDVRLPDLPSRVCSCPSGFEFARDEHLPRGEVEEAEEVEEMEEEIPENDSHHGNVDSDSFSHAIGFFH